MRCRCVGNRGESIPQYLGVKFFKPSVSFALTVGEVYPVLGMELHRGFLYILVPDNTERRWPQWMPNELFEFRLSEIPTGTSAATPMVRRSGRMDGWPDGITSCWSN